MSRDVVEVYPRYRGSVVDDEFDWLTDVEAQPGVHIPVYPSVFTGC
jgi:hypothetical protein